MKLNRRNFLLGSAAAATLAGCATKMGVRPRKPGEPINVAMIGVGIQGRTALLPQFLEQTEAFYDLVDGWRRQLVDFTPSTHVAATGSDDRNAIRI